MPAETENSRYYMLKLSELKEWLETLWEIIVDLNICINNAKRLVNPQNDLEEKVINHGFFQLHFAQLKFVVIIQVCKVLSKNSNQKLNVHKLLNRLSNEKYDNELKGLLEKNLDNERELKSRNDILMFVKNQKEKIQELSSIIERTEILRDKLYAHKDPGKNPQNVSFEELEQLVKFCSTLHNKFDQGFFGAITFFEMTRDWDIGYVVDAVTANRQSELDKIQSKFNN